MLNYQRISPISIGSPILILNMTGGRPVSNGPNGETYLQPDLPMEHVLFFSKGVLP